MESPDVIFGLLIVCALVFGLAWLVMRHPRLVKLEGAPAQIESVADVAQLAAAAAPVIRDLVAGAEQLWRTGKLDKDGRLDWVFDQVETLYPELDDDVILSLIEGAVYWLKPMVEGAVDATGQADAVSGTEVEPDHLYGFRTEYGPQYSLRGKTWRLKIGPDGVVRADSLELVE
jgi:hypothetical protein